MHGHEYTVQRYTFISQWTAFFIYFQVFYLIVVMMTLTIYTLMLFFEKIGHDSDQLYLDYVESRIEEYEGKGIPSERQVVILTWLFRGVIIAVLPSAFLVYRSRTVSLLAFQAIKMH